MSKTKKLLTVLLSFLCAICFAFALVACGGNENQGGGDDVDPYDGFEVTVLSIGGVPLEDVAVALNDGDAEIEQVYTNENGVARFQTETGTFTIALSELPDGYEQPTQSYTLSDAEKSVEIRLTSHIIQSPIPKGYRYKVGDVVYDFTVETTQGVFTVSELLQTKRMVLLNFWATWCGPCRAEFPYMQSSYLNHNGDEEAEIIALSQDDNLASVRAFATENNLTFPMGYDSLGLHSYFSISSIPVTVVVDRYGVFALRHVGSIRDTESFDALFETYCSDDYNPGYKGDDNDTSSSLEKPDVTMPDSSVLEAAANDASFKGTYRPVTANETAQYEYFWPWLAGEDEKGTYIYSSNIMKQKKSTSLVYLDFHIEKDQLLAFDYDISAETEYDYFYIFKDNYASGSQIFEATGIAENQTAYVYIAVEAGDHTIGLSYATDDANAANAPYTDEVKIRNIRLIDKSELPAGADLTVRYHCATGPVAENGTITGWQNYVRVDLNQDDGYYHLLDGNGKPTGPYVLADLLTGTTHWSSAPVMSYLENDASGLTAAEASTLYSYASYASLSDINGYTPVTKELKELLTKLTANVGSGDANEWLEICSYFIHYGSAGTDPNETDPLLGSAPFSAILLRTTEGIPEEKYELYNQIDITKIYIPRGIYAAFIPERTGLYRFKAYGEDPQTHEELATICYITDENGEQLSLRSDDLMNLFQNHFDIYVRLEQGKKYFVRCDMDMPGTFGTFYVGIERITHDVEVLRTMTTGFYTYDEEKFNATGEYYYYPETVAYNYVQDETTGNWYANRGIEGVAESKLYLNMTGTSAFNDVFGGISLAQILSDDNLNAQDGIYYYMQKDANGNPIYAADDDGNPIYDDKGNPVYYKTYKLDFDFSREDGINYTINGTNYNRNFNAAMKQYLERAKQNNGLVEVDDRLGIILTLFARRVSIWRNPGSTYLDQYTVNGQAVQEWIGLCCYYDYYKA